MSKAWPKVRLGEVLTEQKVRIGSYDADSLPLLGVNNVDGLHVSGKARISDMSRYLRVQDQWFAYNPMRINVGSIGWAETKDLTGVISPDYVVFSCTNRIEPKLLYLFLRSKMGLQAIDFETAGSVRARLYFDSLGRLEFPLPSLAEQQRIVARIEELAAQINEASTLRKEAIEHASMLVYRTTEAKVDQAGWISLRLRDVLRETPRNGLSPQPEVLGEGRPMLRINAVSSSPTRFVDLTAAKNVEVQDNVAAPFILQHDDVFIVRYNGDINRVARPAIFKDEGKSSVVYPDKLMRLRTDKKQMLPDFLVFALNTRSVREQIEELGKTTAGNIGINGGNVQSFLVPVPPLPEQRRIVAELDALQAEVDALKRLQAESAAELDALLPAILDKAFKGKL